MTTIKTISVLICDRDGGGDRARATKIKSVTSARDPEFDPGAAERGPADSKDASDSESPDSDPSDPARPRATRTVP